MIGRFYSRTMIKLENIVDGGFYSRTMIKLGTYCWACGMGVDRGVGLFYSITLI